MTDADLIAELQTRRMSRRGETEVICSKAAAALTRLQAENEGLQTLLESIIDTVNSFRDGDGHEIAAQVRIRINAAKGDTPHGNG
jgi:hypothetical protein